MGKVRKSRQPIRDRRTKKSNTKATFFILSLGWILIWSAPIWVRALFPDFIVWSSEPWQLNEADLGMRRILSNLVVKPGLRMTAGIAFGVAVVGLKWLVFDHLKGSKRDWKAKLPSFGNFGSTEFVVEGRRASLLVEFAREIEAV